VKVSSPSVKTGFIKASSSFSGGVSVKVKLCEAPFCLNFISKFFGFTCQFSGIFKERFPSKSFL